VTLGLPEGMRACLFDMDGVLTQTARVHMAAWKQMFDEFLQRRAAERGEQFVPFEPRDYTAHVDGKPRSDGVRSFLASRGIELHEGARDDPPDADTVAGLGNRKNALVLRLIDEDGVAVFEGSIRYVEAARDAGLRRAVVSSSANTHAVLRSCGIEELFDEVVDAGVAQRLGLRGKPAPDTFLHGAALLETPPDQAVVFEDALAGVEAGRAGRFGYVIGVDRAGQAEQLREHGANVVVSDLGELLSEG
jgi:beta-phosphoglucomutase family hydrolase